MSSTFSRNLYKTKQMFFLLCYQVLPAASPAYILKSSLRPSSRIKVSPCRISLKSVKGFRHESVANRQIEFEYDYYKNKVNKVGNKV